MISSVNSSISALHVFGKKMGVTANNVANVNTDGYKKYRTNMTEGANNDIKVEIRRVESPGHTYQAFEGDQTVTKETSNVDLGEEIPEMITTRNGYSANLKALEAQDEMLGSLLDIVS